MQYLLLIYEDEKLMAESTDAERLDLMQRYRDYTAKLRESGAFVAGDALQSVSTAKTVRIRAGDATHTDGPFAETAEQLGGYYLIEASNLDDAIEWARQIPAAERGSVEVRPIMNY